MTPLEEIARQLSKCLHSREQHKEDLAVLRRMCVEVIGLPQDVAQRTNPIDLADGFLRGVRYEQ